MAVGERTGKIKVDSKKCTGCRLCQQVCVFSREHFLNPRKAKLNVLINEREGIYAPLICSQCKTCLGVCNRDALSWDEKVGVIRVDAKRCNACGLCIEACPNGAIVLDPTSKIVNICDLCNGDPECVKWCSEGALQFEPA